MLPNVFLCPNLVEFGTFLLVLSVFLRGRNFRYKFEKKSFVRQIAKGKNNHAIFPEINSSSTIYLYKYCALQCAVGEIIIEEIFSGKMAQ